MIYRPSFSSTDVGRRVQNEFGRVGGWTGHSTRDSRHIGDPGLYAIIIIKIVGKVCYYLAHYFSKENRRAHNFVDFRLRRSRGFMARRYINQTHLLSDTHRSHSADTDTQLVRSLQEHLRYFLLVYTLFCSTRPLATGMYHHYPRPRSKTVVATLPVRSTANGAGAGFPLPGHPRWPWQGGTCRKLRLSVKCAEIRQ